MSCAPQWRVSIKNLSRSSARESGCSGVPLKPATERRSTRPFFKVTATSAVVGAVVGEFVASQAGLGYVIITTQSSMNTPVAFAALAFISHLGLALFAFVGILSRALVPWGEVADL